jgi:hypothetical protein
MELRFAFLFNETVRLRGLPLAEQATRGSDGTAIETLCLFEFDDSFPVRNECSPSNPRVAAACGESREDLQLCQVGDAGLEQFPKGTGNTIHRVEGAAESGASESQNGPETARRTAVDRPEVDPELARVVEAWPDLPEHIRAAVMALVTSASAKPAS